jgi:HSP20 family protein
MTLPALRRSEEPVGRWDPVHELEQDFGQLFERLNRLMPSAVGQQLPGLSWIPAVDLEETDDAFVVEAELPGVKREDIDVSWRDRELSITGEVKDRERKGLLRHTTRRTGRFAYRVTLPGDIDADAVEASLHAGVLKVRLPKTQAAQPRRIEIRSS